MRRLPILLVLCAALIPGAAQASAMGSLTSAEYAQLVSARDRLRTANVKTLAQVKTALHGCEAIEQVSPLITEVRADCIAQIEIGGFGPTMQVTVKNCSGFPSVSKRLSCMLPSYELFATDTADFYNAEVTIRRLASARNLPAECVNLLSDPPAVVAKEKQMLDTLESLVAAMKSGALLPFEKDSGELITIENANSGSLAVCVHQ
jgi:hypothetical protein